MFTKELKDLLFEAMPVNGVREFLHEAYDETEACEAVKTAMAEAYNPWKAAYEMMTLVYGTPIGSALITNKLFELDEKRDTISFAIDVMLRVALKSEDPEVEAAGKTAEQMRVSFPIDPNAKFNDETAQIDTFLGVALGEQLETTTKAGLLPLVQQLKECNDQIHSLLTDRNAVTADRNKLPSRPAARQAAIEAWRFLVKYVNGYNIVVLHCQPTEAIANYVDKMNARVDRYKSIYLGGNGSGNGNDSGTITPPAEEGAEGEGGESTGGSGEGGSEGEQETTPTKYTATFVANGATVATQEYEAGEVISAPAAPSGYEWEDFPYRMPANDITVNAVRKNIPGGGGGSGFE